MHNFYTKILFTTQKLHKRQQKSCKSKHKNQCRINRLTEKAESKYQVYDDSILDTTSPTTESNAFVVHLLDSGERERGFIEGFVLEDNTGFMFKYKTPYYRFWKELRTKIEKALCTRTLPKPSKCHTSY